MDDFTKDLDILLLGKTGNGKSATGNSILMRRAFNACASSTSVTSELAFEFSRYKNRTLKVVDSPGVIDTRDTSDEALNRVTKKMSDAISANPEGYHAFLLVLRYGPRFTEEDVNAVYMLKRIFGENFVKKFCILILTCGDTFQVDNEDTGISFRYWCSKQTGCFSDIVKECNNRVVLFNNYTKDQNEKERQLDELISIVDHLCLRGRRYTDHYFEKARLSREKFLVESKIPVIQEKTLRETSYALQELSSISKLDPNNQLTRLNELLPHVVHLVDEVNNQDKGTGALDNLKATVEGLRNTVETEIKVCQRVIQERETMNREMEQLRWEREFDAKNLQALEERERKAQEAQTDTMKRMQQKINTLEDMHKMEKERFLKQPQSESWCSIL